MDDGKIKVIFLDVDGVLNCKYTRAKTKRGFTFVDHSKILRIKKIVDITGAKVVLSSDWRYDRDDPKCNQEFLELTERLAKEGISFYGFTPIINGGFNRGIEIQSWLDKHPETETFVILDDRNDMEPNMKRLIRTKMRYGLTEELMNQAINMLEEHK